MVLLQAKAPVVRHEEHVTFVAVLMSSAAADSGCQWRWKYKLVDMQACDMQYNML
jgi:hypothetical protein